jgi:chorismate mutase
MTKGIRGATTVDANTPEAIKEATLELLNEMLKQNNVEKSMISHVIFTLTHDLNAVFPAQFARMDLGWDDVAMMCFNELDVPGALPKVLRVLLVVNNVQNPKFVYVKGAEALRL